MKKFVLFTAVVASLFLGGCKFFGKKAASSAENKVYSFGFDGFTNMRIGPSFSDRVVGQFRNGPEGATLIQNLGDWLMVDCDGLVGYVPSVYVWRTPTEAYSGVVSVDWVKGAWVNADGEMLLVYNNGTWTFLSGAPLAYGFFIMQKEEVNFIPVWEVGSGFKGTFSIDPVNDQLGLFERALLHGQTSKDYKKYRRNYNDVIAQYRAGGKGLI